jgi:hypothetical protein
MKGNTIFWALAVFACLVSCQPSTQTNTIADTTATATAPSTEISTEEGAVSEAGGGAPKVNLPNLFEAGTVLLSLENYFTLDEVNQYKKCSFLGLFYDSTTNLYHLRKTPTSFVETGIVYDDGRTSFECGVKLNNQEACLFLISNTYLTQEIKGMKNFLNKPRFFKPDEQLTYTARNIDYTLFATDYLVEPTGSQTHLDYKLILKSTTQNGTTSETLLSFIPWFDDGAVTVVFIGDLDGDNYPDYIIDNASKYTGVSNSGILYSTKASATQGMPKPISQQEQGSIGKQEHTGELGC